MTEFQGIPINESKLLYLYWFVIAVGLVMLICVLWLTIRLIKETTCHSSAETKAQQRIKNLKEKAKDDPTVEKELNRRLRRRKQQSKGKNRTILEQSLLLSLMIALLIGLFYGSRDFLRDYHEKDYVVYRGSFEYVIEGDSHVGRRRTINLPDGQSLSGAPDSWNAEGTYSGTLVYGKHSHVVVGMELDD